MSSSTQLAVQSIRSIVESDGYKKRFESMLGKRTPQFIASISNIVSQSEYLAKCEPRSIILSAVMAATLDLPIEKSLGFAAIVPYGNTATFQIMYKGLIQLAMRSGQYASMRDAMINEEAFKGYDDIGEPIIDWKALDETKPPVGYAFVWRTINGFKKTVYWSKAKCLAHGRKYSKSFSDPKAQWAINPDAMCLKTVIRAGLSKYGILSVQMQTALASEDVELTTDEEGNLVPASTTNLDAAPESNEPSAPEQTMSQRLADAPKRGPGRPPKNVTPAPEEKKAEPPAAGHAQETPAQPPQEPARDAQPPKETPPASAAEPPKEKAAPVDRDALISKMQESCLDHRVSESRLLDYARKVPGLVHEGAASVWEISTESLLKLEPAIKAIAKPAGK